jgi:hypothetical protein
MSAYDEKVAHEEASPMSADEAKWYEEALQAVPEDQRKAFATIPMDVLCVSSLPRQDCVYSGCFQMLVAFLRRIKQGCQAKI